jgi:ubiquinone/menaquinone biosynthesis C-methylase UbiE
MMNNLNESISNQYSTVNLFDSIKNALLRMNKNLDMLIPKDLAPVDFFHIRGYQSTKELAELCNIEPNMKILDVGSGIGGTARFLALQYGCFVTGLDIIGEYTRTASNLSAILKLYNKTEFKTGDASQLPFQDEAFDVVWTENVQMNIENKNNFYSEIYRVLKRGGKFVFHDVFKGNVDNVYYPVPWANDESISFLMEVNEIKQLLKSFSYNITYWMDKTEVSADAFEKSAEKIKRDGLPPLGLHLLMGQNTTKKILNMAQNLAEKQLTVIQCICLK